MDVHRSQTKFIIMVRVCRVSCVCLCVCVCVCDEQLCATKKKKQEKKWGKSAKKKIDKQQFVEALLSMNDDLHDISKN